MDGSPEEDHIQAIQLVRYVVAFPLCWLGETTSEGKTFCVRSFLSDEFFMFEVLIGVKSFQKTAGKKCLSSTYSTYSTIAYCTQSQLGVIRLM